MLPDIKKIWIKQESLNSKEIQREQIDTIEGMGCYIGFIGYTGARMFQLEVESTINIHKNYVHRFKGVEISVIPGFDSTIQKFSIILIEKELTDIFTLFIEDIIDKLTPIQEVREALNSIHQRINYWRKLFARINGEILTPEKQRGLFGELFTLQTLLTIGKNNAVILDSWTGPLSANQDFILNNNAVEVKTSKVGNPSVYISNEYQLDYTDWDHLYLCMLIVNESAGNQGTLYNLVYAIKDLLSNEERLISKFEYKLSLAGINNDTLENYNEISYSVRSYRFYEIRNGFPLITRETLDTEIIHNVKYQINIGKCENFEIEEEKVFDIIL